MSLERRLREGLSANTEHLQPYLERELEMVVQSAHRRRRVRTAGISLAAIAAVAAGVFWLPGVADSIRAGDDPGPAAPPTETVTSPPLLGEGALTQQLTPGTYQVTALSHADEQTPDTLVEVPSGFDEEADWYVVSHDGNQFLGLYTVRRIARDACGQGERGSVTPGPSVEDLAAALVDQKSTRASTPERVTLAGYQGQYVELTGPRDISTCDPPPGISPERGIYGDGQIDLLWILDVDGQRLVVDAGYSPKSTTSDIGKLTSMVESLEFVVARD